MTTPSPPTARVNRFLPAGYVAYSPTLTQAPTIGQVLRTAQEVWDAMELMAETSLMADALGRIYLRGSYPVWHQRPYLPLPDDASGIVLPATIIEDTLALAGTDWTELYAGAAPLAPVCDADSCPAQDFGLGRRHYAHQCQAWATRAVRAAP